MKVTDKFFALRHVSPFDTLWREELVLIAEVAKERGFAPGELVAVAGAPAARLYVVIRGRLLRADATPAPIVFGALSLLYNYPLAQNLYAAPEGEMLCLLIGKGHFFTMVNECPAFTAGLMALARAEASFYDTAVPMGDLQ